MSDTSTVQERRASGAGMPGSSGAGKPAAGSGAARRHLGIALVVIAAAQLMVVLDASIVNVALPHIQRALGFSGSGLEWVITAYSVTFGGLLLLGGRAGDLLGRRRVFIAGLVLFSAASLAGGFARSEVWLLAARAVQGAGGAMIAPTALALITTTFPEGGPRNRAMAVYSAMSGAGLAIGLLGGGLLTNYLSWRWVMFVNVPIGILTALAAPLVLVESQRRRGRFDLPGAIAGTGAVASLVYGLSNASTDSSGVSHWGDTKVIVALAAAFVLLVAFVLIEWRSRHALLPLRILANRNRSGSYLMMLAVATAMFGIFFFLTIFVQEVLGYGALETGVAFLPFAAGVVVMSGIASQLVSRIGARPLMLAGTAIATGGMYWFSRLTEHSSYVNGLLGPILVTVAGLGLIFVPVFLTALNRVRNEDSGVAASLLNTGQQVGGAIGLAALGTVVWGDVAASTRSQLSQAAAAAARAGHPVPAPHAGMQIPAPILNHALATGISRGFVVAGGIMLLAFLVALLMVRVRRADLAGQDAATTIEARADGAASTDPADAALAVDGGVPAVNGVPAVTGDVNGGVTGGVNGGGPLVTGRIREPDGTPVGGSAVTLIDTAGREAGRASAGPDGSFQIAAPAAGLYTLIAIPAAHQPQASTVRVGAVTDGPVYHDVTVAGIARLAGTARNVGGRAVPDARVALLDGDGNLATMATTGEDGSYAFEDLPPGEYTVVASGYPPVAEPVEVTPGQPRTHDVVLGHPES